MAEPFVSTCYKSPTLEEECQQVQGNLNETERRLRLTEARIAEWEKDFQNRQAAELMWC